METPAPQSQLHVYLLMGQSNMAGRGKLEEVPRVDDPRILVFNRNNEWEIAADPLHWDKPEIIGVGPGLGFAPEMLRHQPGVTIGLVPCAFGGTALSLWEKDAPLFVAAAARARSAAETGTLKGILWHQGESDSQADLAPTYAARLEQMFADFRQELNAPELPIVVGETGRFWDGEFDPDPAQFGGERSPTQIVNDGLRAVADKDPSVGFVDSKGLTDNADKLHFDAVSARELGRRYAVATLALQEPPR